MSGLFLKQHNILRPQLKSESLSFGKHNITDGLRSSNANLTVAVKNLQKHLQVFQYGHMIRVFGSIWACSAPRPQSTTRRRRAKGQHKSSARPPLQSFLTSDPWKHLPCHAGWPPTLRVRFIQRSLWNAKTSPINMSKVQKEEMWG